MAINYMALRTNMALMAFAITILLFIVGILYTKLRKTKKQLDAANMRYACQFTRMQTEQSAKARQLRKEAEWERRHFVDGFIG